MAIIPNEQPTFGFDVTTPSQRVAVSALNLGTTIDDVQLSAIERIADYVWTHYDRTLSSGGGGSGGASAADVWSYASRTLTQAVATPTNVSDAQTAIIAAIPTANISAIRAKTDALPADTAAEFTALADAIAQIPTDATLDQATLTAIAEAVRDLDYISTTSLKELLLGIAARVNGGL